MTLLAGIFDSAAVTEAWEIIKSEFLFATWETLYVTFVATFFSIILGLPLGILLVAGENKQIIPVPKWVLKILDVLINLLRSIPFLILIVVVIPITRFIVGTTVGTVPSIVPLVIAGFPFVARLVEGSMREIDSKIIETAKSMGATPLQIIFKVMIPESIPSLIMNFTVAITTILGYTAMSGVLGGGGLGKIAIDLGYYRYKTLVMYAAVVLLIILVQVFQSVGTKIATSCDKRIKTNK